MQNIQMDALLSPSSMSFSAIRSQAGSTKGNSLQTTQDHYSVFAGVAQGNSKGWDARASGLRDTRGQDGQGNHSGHLSFNHSGNVSIDSASRDLLSCNRYFNLALLVLLPPSSMLSPKCLVPNVHVQSTVVLLQGSTCSQNHSHLRRTSALSLPSPLRSVHRKVIGQHKNIPM